MTLGKHVKVDLFSIVRHSILPSVSAVLPPFDALKSRAAYTYNAGLGRLVLVVVVDLFVPAVALSVQ